MNNNERKIIRKRYKTDWLGKWIEGTPTTIENFLPEKWLNETSKIEKEIWDELLKENKMREHADLIHLWADNPEYRVEKYNGERDEWFEVFSPPQWLPGSQYRIQTTKDCDEKTVETGVEYKNIKTGFTYLFHEISNSTAKFKSPAITLDFNQSKCLKRVKPELLSCPFCGSEQIGIYDSVSFWAHCDICGCKTINYTYKDDAVKAWNRRA